MVMAVQTPLASLASRFFHGYAGADSAGPACFSFFMAVTGQTPLASFASLGDIRGCPFGPAMLKRDRHFFESPGMCAQAHWLHWVQIRDGDVTPFYMTFGLLPF